MSTWDEVRSLFRKWREESRRNSSEVVDLWQSVLESHSRHLGNEKWVVLEQVCIAALDCGRIELADDCLTILSVQFPSSLRIRKLRAMKLEAQEKYTEALELYNTIIEQDDTNSSARKRKVAVLKAQGKNTDAIRELTEYLKKFMGDQEAWMELCELYLKEFDYGKAAFCMEELLLHSPHNHLYHQKYADIRYTMGGVDNLEMARAYYSQALKLHKESLRALYGLMLTCSQIAHSTKVPSAKKKECAKLAGWARDQIQHIHGQTVSKSTDVSAEQVSNPTPTLEALMSSLSVSTGSTSS